MGVLLILGLESIPKGNNNYGIYKENQASFNFWIHINNIKKGIFEIANLESRKLKRNRI